MASHHKEISCLRALPVGKCTSYKAMLLRGHSGVPTSCCPNSNKQKWRENHGHPWCSQKLSHWDEKHRDAAPWPTEIWPTNPQSLYIISYIVSISIFILSFERKCGHLAQFTAAASPTEEKYPAAKEQSCAKAPTKSQDKGETFRGMGFNKDRLLVSGAQSVTPSSLSIEQFSCSLGSMQHYPACPEVEMRNDWIDTTSRICWKPIPIQR